jgi:hypothetical protein
MYYYEYLENDSIRRWNRLEHVTGDKLQIVMTGAVGVLADNVRKVHHGALDAWESTCDDFRAFAFTSADIDERVHATEDAALVKNNDLEE